MEVWGAAWGILPPLEDLPWEIRFGGREEASMNLTGETDTSTGSLETWVWPYLSDFLCAFLSLSGLQFGLLIRKGGTSKSPKTLLALRVFLPLSKPPTGLCRWVLRPFGIPGHAILRSNMGRFWHVLCPLLQMPQSTTLAEQCCLTKSLGYWYHLSGLPPE